MPADAAELPRERLRRSSIVDRLDGLIVSAERYQRDAFDDARPSDAVRWFELAGRLKVARDELAK